MDAFSFIIGLFLGGAFGVFLTALCSANGRDEDE